jgi:hypothetical protein
VRLVGKVSLERPQDQFPPFSINDVLLCDSSGCIYIYDDTEDLKKFVGKRVKVLGYGRVTKFNFPYIEVIEIKEAEKE